MNSHNLSERSQSDLESKCFSFIARQHGDKQSARERSILMLKPINNDMLGVLALYSYMQ